MGAKRSSLSKRTRFAVFERDEFTCQYCGERPPLVVLHLDHIHPVSKGGEDTEENLVTSCVACNAGKSDRVLGDIRPRPDANLQFLSTQQEIAEARLYLEAKEQRDDLHRQIAVELLDVWDDHAKGWYKRPDAITVIGWITDFGASEVELAIKTASRRDKTAKLGGNDAMLRYVAGILKNRRNEA